MSKQIANGRAARRLAPLVGRDREREELDRALREIGGGRGGLRLVAGEAGVGKSRLVADLLESWGGSSIVVAASPTAASPYGLIVDAFRAFLRLVPKGLSDCGPLTGHLGLLLPELGAAPKTFDRAALFEAIRCAFVAMGRSGPLAVLLDDLHWADDTTLELLPVLGGALEDEPVLLLATYRTDEVPRGHPLRRMRTELRRAGRLRELALEPLDLEGTCELTGHLFGERVSHALALTIFLRTQGVPFFVEELVQALALQDRIAAGPRGVVLVGGDVLPLPESVRDTLLLRAAALSDAARDALHVAAVAGVPVETSLLIELAADEGLEEALETGLLVEAGDGGIAFRHSLAREAVYASVPRARRRALHRELALRLGERSAPAAEIAEHWLLALEPEQGRRALLEAARSSCAMHAYRDALRAVRRALDIWRDGVEESVRLDALEMLGDCAQLSGELDEAARAWQEAAEGRTRNGDVRGLAHLQRRLAGLHELQCRWEDAFSMRDAAADSFSSINLPEEAAAERLAAAANLQSAGSLTAALELVRQARTEASSSDRRDLEARALGLEGLVRARLGEPSAGIELARSGLSVALAEGLTGPVAEVYDRLGLILENASDYRGALAAWDEAVALCEAHGIADREQVCLSCIAFTMRKTGDWDRALEICRALLSSPDVPRSARCAALGIPGLIWGFRGQARRARTALIESAALARRIGFMILRIEASMGLARLEELGGSGAAAVERCRDLAAVARAGEDRHAPVMALRWATTCFATLGRRDDVGACAEDLARIASLTGSTEALAALAHALGETALLEGDVEVASTQFVHALELLREIELPLDRAEVQLRAGPALAAAGERDLGVERLIDAYRTARKLGARPLAHRAAGALAGLGESVDRRLGRRAAAALEHGGLTRRETEVVRLVASGRTNREIARELFLSPRTVDMHVRNILAKLGARSRTDATRRAAELRIIG